MLITLDNKDLAIGVKLCILNCGDYPRCLPGCLLGGAVQDYKRNKYKPLFLLCSGM